MAKRYQPPKEFARFAKKAKLDVSVNHKSTSNNNGSRSPNFNSNNRNCIDNSLWDDDDVDVVLLATQIDELEKKKAKEAAQAIEASEFNITDRDMTFSEFAPKLVAGSSTSTQCPIIKYTNLAASKKGDERSIAQMFEDDDDDFELLIATATQVENNYSLQEQHPKIPNKNQQMMEADVINVDEEIFKQPTCSKYVNRPPVVTKQQPEAFQNKNNNNNNIDSEDLKRRQLTSERQVQCLMDRIEMLKEENQRLNKDLMSTKSKIEAKDGEASLLRDELRHTKHQVQELKRKNISNVEKTEKECQMKIEKLAKEMQVKETQLQLKSVEYSVLRMRQADESRKLEMSMRNESMALLSQADLTAVPKEKPGVAESKQKNRGSIWFMPNLQIDSIKTTPMQMELVQTPEEFYKPHLSRVGIMKQLSAFQVEQINLQKLESRLHLEHCDIDKISEEVLSSAQKIFHGFSCHVQKLAYPNYTEKLEPLNYNLFEDDAEHHGPCALHKETPMYSGERCIHLRRAIIALSHICLKSPIVTKNLLNAKDSENNYFLQKPTICISTMSYARDFPRYFGVIEAFSIFVRCIALHLDENEPNIADHVEIVVDFLKEIIFTRPTPWILKQVSFSVLDLAVRFPECLELFCEKSPEHSFVVDRVNAVCRFYGNTCLMQVYCGLLESAFPLYLRLNRCLFKLLCTLCLNQLSFIFELFVNPPEFIRNQLPPDSDDEEENNEDAGIPNANNDGNAAAILEKATQAQNNLNEKPSTSKAARKQKNESLSDKKDNTSGSIPSTEMSNETNSSAMGDMASESTDESTCCCYMQMCLGILPLIYKVILEWCRSDCQWETPIVGEICRLAIQLINKIYIECYQTRLFYHDEDRTRHYLYIITRWCEEHEDKLKFSDVIKNCLKDLLESHVIPKDYSDEDCKLENIADDLGQYNKETGEKIIVENTKHLEETINKLNLTESIFNGERLFEVDDNQEFNKDKVFDEMIRVLHQSKGDNK